ncbi:hypothetical protein ABE288_11625 [Bacillus salipaludis]|uniref:hypothetical protein n=1 Tax=Bacillus salipaludis TaxID=2547811 RepID=UPI003D1CA659
MVFIEGLKTPFIDVRKRFGLHQGNEDHFSWIRGRDLVFIEGMKTISMEKRKRFGLHQGNEDHFHGKKEEIWSSSRE